MIFPYRIIDLTMPLHSGMRGVRFESKFSTARGDGWNATTLELYSHAGTHVDAPTHTDAGTETIDQIPLQRCCGRVRVCHLPNLPAKTVLTPSHLGTVAKTFRPGEALLLATSWSQYVSNSAMYRDQLPRIGPELARWCVTNGVQVLGVEPPSVADVHNRAELQHIHNLLLSGGVTIVEGLANLDQLHDDAGWFFAAPLPIVGGDGCPCRAFAVVSEHF